MGARKAATRRINDLHSRFERRGAPSAIPVHLSYLQLLSTSSRSVFLLICLVWFLNSEQFAALIPENTWACLLAHCGMLQQYNFTHNLNGHHPCNIKICMPDSTSSLMLAKK